MTLQPEQEWQRLYTEALLETDPHNLAGLVALAEKAMLLRVAELCTVSGRRRFELVSIWGHILCESEQRTSSKLSFYNSELNTQKRSRLMILEWNIEWQRLYVEALLETNPLNLVA